MASPPSDIADHGLPLAAGRRLPSWLRPLAAAPGSFQPLRLALNELPMHDGPAVFAQRALERFGVSYRLPGEQLQRVPQRGAAIIVANHPFGGVDGLIAIAALAAYRPDLKILALGLLARIPALAGVVLPIDPFGSHAAARGNAPAVRRALRHLEAGGLLLMFPAGEVSHFSPRRGSVSDAQWSHGAARIVQLSGAPVLPLYFRGRNSLVFQIGGLLHPRVRTLLLMRELLNKSGQCVEVRIGRLLPPARLAAFNDAGALASHLRATTYLLGSDAPPQQSAQPATQPLRAPVAPERIAAEIAALPAECRLATLGSSSAYVAPARDIPHTLQELGRLREQSFRAAGEGTGRSADIDLYDDYYEQLFVWNSAECAIAGGYRLGRTDEIRRRFGDRGLYLNTLFEFREPFFRLLGPALELGRSFVNVAYQRNYAPLLLLWRGICEYVARNPRYARLIGPASISNDYDPVSRALVVRGLRFHCHDPMLSTLVRARHPFATQLSLASLFGRQRRLPDLEALDNLVVDREADGKGLPVLLRQYLKLGARTLAFNVDAQFGHAIDCLITLDVRRLPQATLRRYMSAESLQAFQRNCAATRGIMR